MESDVGNVVIPVDAHLLTLTISKFKIVERPVHKGRDTRMQRERLQTGDVRKARLARRLAPVPVAPAGTSG